MEMNSAGRENPWKPRRVFVNRCCAEWPRTREILSNLGEVPVELVDKDSEVRQALESLPDPESAGKRSLYLTENTSRFLKICPGLGECLACCNLWVLNFAIGCPIDCTYCFLQTYLPCSCVTHFVNEEDLFRQLRELAGERAGQFTRVTTGELSDSLALEPYTGLAHRLIPAFVAQKDFSLELKTKTANIEGLEQFAPQGRIILSWSLNSQSAARLEELKSDTLEQRFAAAHQADQWGYRVGFHFDPIFHYPGWEEEYGQTIERIFQAVRPEAIAWISLGTIRFDPRLKEIAQRRFPRSRFVYGELIPGPDGKMRYPQPLRVEVFSKIRRMIHSYSDIVPVYLCMESFDVWKKVFGRAPESREEVSAFLDHSILHGPRAWK
jgi:spore photoproduct lyase